MDDCRFGIDDLRVDSAEESQIVNQRSKIVNQIAWLSLDEGDSDPTRFLEYVVAALQTIRENVGQEALGALQSPQPPPIESILTALLNDIAAAPDPFVLVLDDYHVLDSPPIDHALAFLLEHLPPQMHLVIATREDPNLPLARVLIAQYRSERKEHRIAAAVRLLERLLQAAEAGGRTGSAIAILVLQALAHAAQGDMLSALAPLARALTLAQPEGYVRIFVDEGAPMAHLLSAAAAHGIMPDYTELLLAALGGGTNHQRPTAHAVDARGATNNEGQTTTPSPSPWIEPLSPRELEVLQLVAEGLSNREISERLFLALSTVKGHNRNIYGKLQVQRRTEAVVRARELGLL